MTGTKIVDEDLQRLENQAVAATIQASRNARAENAAADQGRAGRRQLADGNAASILARADRAVARYEAAADRANGEARMASVRAQRPGFLADPGRDADDGVRATRRAAFQAFIRHGKDGMQPGQIQALRIADDKSGGFLVPMDMEAQLVRNLVQVSQIRQVARVGTTSKDMVRVPKRTSASTASYVSEIETASSTAPGYGAVDVPICDARCYIDISNNLLEDAAIDIEAELATELATEFGRLEGAALSTAPAPRSRPG